MCAAHVTPVSKSYLLLRSVRKFYCSNPAFTNIFYDVVKYRKGISLRILDWLVTNYSKKHNVQYKVNSCDFNLFLSYKGCLKAFSKRAFDPFARRDRVELSLLADEQDKVFTTVAQLNFFKWCFLNNVLDYALNHLHEIEGDMLNAIAHRYEDKPVGVGRKKRRELSKNNTRTHVRVDVFSPLI
jgi:hypothetical protein